MRTEDRQGQSRCDGDDAEAGFRRPYEILQRALVTDDAQALGDVAECGALTDARHDRRGLSVQACRRDAAEGRADGCRLHGCPPARVHLLEGVVPQRAHPAEGVAAVILHALHVAEQVEDAGDVIQVDVADEGHAQIEGAAVAQLIDPPPQHLPVDAVRAAVDEDAQRRRAGSRVMEQQAVAVVRLERVNGESHVSNRLNGAEDVDDPAPPGSAARGRDRWRSGTGCP